jgi:hypothetical protein
VCAGGDRFDLRHDQRHRGAVVHGFGLPRLQLGEPPQLPLAAGLSWIKRHDRRRARVTDGPGYISMSHTWAERTAGLPTIRP